MAHTNGSKFIFIAYAVVLKGCVCPCVCVCACLRAPGRWRLSVAIIAPFISVTVYRFVVYALASWRSLWSGHGDHRSVSTIFLFTLTATAIAIAGNAHSVCMRVHDSIVYVALQLVYATTPLLIDGVEPRGACCIEEGLSQTTECCSLVSYSTLGRYK